jgi:hypothetical protein
MSDHRPIPTSATTSSVSPARRALVVAVTAAALIAAAWAASAVYDNFARHSALLANLVLSLLGVGVVAGAWIAFRLTAAPAPPSIVRMEPVDLRLPAADPETILLAVRRRLAFGSAAAGATGAALQTGNRGLTDDGGIAPPPEAGPSLRLAWVHLLWEAGKRKEALELLRQAAEAGSQADAKRAGALRELMELEWAARRRAEGAVARIDEAGI